MTATKTPLDRRATVVSKQPFRESLLHLFTMVRGCKGLLDPQKLRCVRTYLRCGRLLSRLPLVAALYSNTTVSSKCSPRCSVVVHSSGTVIRYDKCAAQYLASGAANSQLPNAGSHTNPELRALHVGVWILQFPSTTKARTLESNQQECACARMSKAFCSRLSNVSKFAAT